MFRCGTFSSTRFLIGLVPRNQEVMVNDIPKGSDLSPVAFAAGMILGALVGFAIWMATDTFVFFPAFLGVGVVFGLIFDTARKRKEQ